MAIPYLFQVSFSFRVEPSTTLYVICLVLVLVYAFCFQVPYWMPYSPMEAQPLGFAPLQPFRVYPQQAYVQPDDGHWSTPGVHRVAAPSTALRRRSLLSLNQLSPSHSNYIQLLGLDRESPNPSAFPAWRGGVFFPGLIPFNNMVNSESVVGIKPGDSGVVIGYQVDEFTHTWSAEQFVAHSLIYPGFTGKVSSLSHFPLKPGCEDYSLLDKAVAVFEQGLDSTLTDSIKTAELDTSLDEPDAVTSSVSSGFLYSVLFLILLNCSLLHIATILTITKNYISCLPFTSTRYISNDMQAHQVHNKY